MWRTLKPTVLVVDDDEAMRAVLGERLQQWGYTAVGAGSYDEAEKELHASSPDVVLSDVVLGDRTGLDVLRASKEQSKERPVLLLTAHATIDLSVEAMKEGAEDFLTKPLDHDKLRTTLESITRDLESSRRQRDVGSNLSAGRARYGRLIGDSDAMKQVFEQMEQVAATQASVLILGESGTGKELTARTLHERSPRADAPFVAINAAAIPSELMESEVFGHEKGAFTGATESRPGCFELADGGTLFLDEIAEMSSALQPKLLRVLEDSRIRRLGSKTERQIDVRVLAATNQDPDVAIEKGLLRQDLYYRLNVFAIQLPPLRERASDIPLLAAHLLEDSARKHGHEIRGFRDETMAALEAYSWPGNVRELRNVVERATIVAKERWIEPGHLPAYVRDPKITVASDAVKIPVGTTVAEAERALILSTLEQTGNNKSEAARRLGIDVKTVRTKLKSYGAEGDDEESA